MGLLAAAALGALAACDPLVPTGPAPAPSEEPGPAAAPAEAARSQTSHDLERHYAQVQADLLSQGMLRTDGGGPDTPFAAHTLANNFIRIALYDEYVTRSGKLIAQQTESSLRRWEVPVKFQIQFGATIPPEQRVKDTNSLTGYARRLRDATGHPISTTTAGGNFHVLVLNEDERRAVAPALRELVPGISDTAVNTVADMPRDTFCLVFAFSQADNPAYTRAIAVIRGEHPDLLRLSCFHEELAQGLGLANDSPAARPSIFNDDEEFGLLTTQDELMLRILYDPRLRPGMTAAEARPIVNTIAQELIGGES